MSVTEAEMRQNLQRRKGVIEVKSLTTHYDPRSDTSYLLARAKVSVGGRKENRWYGLVVGIDETTDLSRADYDKIRKQCETSRRRYALRRQSEVGKLPALTAEGLAALTGKPVALCARHVEKLGQRTDGSVLAAAALRSTLSELGLVTGVVMVHWYYDSKTGELRAVVPAASGESVFWVQGRWCLGLVASARKVLGSCNVYNTPQMAA